MAYSCYPKIMKSKALKNEYSTRSSPEEKLKYKFIQALYQTYRQQMNMLRKKIVLENKQMRMMYIIWHSV